MLKFFQKIRRKLLDEGNLKNYLKYAMGEILLVMIGILLALQVNNFNDNRKANRGFEKLLDALEQDLLDNVRNANTIISRGYYRDSLINLVLTETVTKKMYHKNNDLRSLIFLNLNYQHIHDNVSAVLDYDEHFSNRYASLFPLIKKYKRNIDNYNESYPISFGNARKNDEYLAYRFDWYSRDDSISLANQIDYQLSDPIYRNLVSLYREAQLNTNVYKVTRLRALAVEIMVELKRIRNKYNISQIRQLYEDFGLVPFEEVGCLDTMIQKENKIGFRIVFPIFNNKKDTVSLFFLDEYGELMFKRDINPGEYKETTLRKGNRIELQNSVTCIKRYLVSRDGFLIVE